MFDRLLVFHRGAFDEHYSEFDRKVTLGDYRIDTYVAGRGVDPGQVFYSTKHKLQHMDSGDYDLRIALAEETFIHAVPPSESLACHRMIRRFSFNPSPGFRLDMSVVMSTDPNTGQKDESYEVGGAG